MLSSLIAWILRAIPFGTIIMYGAMGEIVTEKSGHLNLGVPGIMYLGGFAGFAGAYYYETLSPNPVGIVSILISVIACLIVSMLGGLIYSFLTVSLRANQNVTGLALSIFGMGFANFFGVFILDGSVATAAPIANKAFSTQIPGLSKIPVVGEMLFSYGFMVYLAVIMAVILHFILYKSRIGLNLRAVGENPGTADAAGVNVTLYKYLATCIGAGISGLGGLYYVMDYIKGTWANDGKLESLGWLAVALVIFSLWRPGLCIIGSFIFGLLYIMPNYITGVSLAEKELVKIIPYVATALVLIIISFFNKRETQPPASLGLSYFREER